MSQGRVVQITLPKCGSQWVRDVLCAPEIAHHTGMRASWVTFSLNSKGTVELPPGMFNGPIYGMNRVEWQHFKSPGDKAVVVLRDPRDVVVSQLFATLYSHGSDVWVDYHRTRLSRLKNDDERIADLIGRAIRRFYLTWVADADGDAYVVTYEALVKDEQAAFRHIVDWLGWQVADDVLRDVVDRLSFKARSGRSRGEVDVTSHYRRGVAGDWRGHFTRANGRLWEELYPGFLVAIGYETSNTWWKGLPDRHEGTEPLQVDQLEMLRTRNRELDRALLEKEQQIRDLSRACVERQAVIDELVNAAARTAPAMEER